MQEFASPFYGQNQVEILDCPFEEQPSHNYLFEKVGSTFEEAGSLILGYWDRLKNTGYLNAIEMAKRNNEVLSITTQDLKGETVSYELGYFGKFPYVCGQEVDVFTFTKDPDDKNKPHAQFIKLSTLAEGNSLIGELAELKIEDGNQILQDIHFNFINGRLVELGQISKPNILFPNYHSDCSQFIDIGLLPEGQDETFILRTGLLDKVPINLGTYQNSGGVLTKSNHLRVANVLSGEMELISLHNECVVDSFRIYPAINNLANFLPATDL